MSASSTKWRPRRPANNAQPSFVRLLFIRARALWLRLTWPAWVPAPVLNVFRRLRQAASPQTYVVGGTVRDLLLGRTTHDWDLATRAAPATVVAAFPRALLTGIAHGTVTVPEDGYAVEVTSLRREGPYVDGRRPAHVDFDVALPEDLLRRDFTINAIAIGWPSTGADPRLASGRPVIFDLHGGMVDLANRVVRAVGDPRARFAEDHLRILRAFRIAAELDFHVSSDTKEAAAALAESLRGVAHERIRAELDRILLAPGPARCLEELREAGAIDVILPELAAGYGFAQNEYHPFDVWYHSILACEYAPRILHLRLAALLHDVGKPASLSIDADGRRHFYGHERISATMAVQIMQRLRYDRATIARVEHLVARHMDLHYLPPDAGDAAVRRAAARVGRANISDLLHLREADRKAAGKQGAVSGGTLRLLRRLRDLDRQQAALSVRDLRIDGHDVMELTGLASGPVVGEVLDRLLDAVIDNPGLNNPVDLARLAVQYGREAAEGR